MTPASNVRALAFYLPQFHPIPENDKWWGNGFTEWTNVTKAVPLFKNHYQPQLPADLGFYDLRVPEAREQQAALARDHGIEGFCYWHYWFAGERLLDRPFREVLESGRPDFPLCLAWANHTWSGMWSGGDDKRRRLLTTSRPPPLPLPTRGRGNCALTKTASATSGCATYAPTANRRSRGLPRVA